MQPSDAISRADQAKNEEGDNGKWFSVGMNINYICTCKHGVHVLVVISFGFPFHCLINWREIFKPITRRSNCNRVITFDRNFKTALCTSSFHATPCNIGRFQSI